MDADDPIPSLIRMLFGDSAPVALASASPRLLLWSAAFDAWLQDRLQHSPQKLKGALWYWGQLLAGQPKMPWDFQPADFESHAAWMRAQGYGDGSLTAALTCYSSFYRWCARQAVDPACPPGFNPALQASRPPHPTLSSARLLGPAELQALLHTLQGDTSPLGLRDAAFILARLRLGVPLRSLQRLEWGQLTVATSAASVRWQKYAHPVPLPDDVWQAIHAYLLASGRLRGMQPGKYIFAPIRLPTGLQSSAQGWHEHSYMTTSQLLRNLKLYGRLAGIPEEKLSLHTLRHTAVRLRLDAGDTSHQIKAFTLGRGKAADLNSRLKALPPLPCADAPQPPPGASSPPNRQANVFPPGHGLKYGLFKPQPPEQVQAVMQERIQGLEQEIAGLRELARGLLEWEQQSSRLPEQTLLMDAYSRAAARLGQLSAAKLEKMEELPMQEAPEEGDGEFPSFVPDQEKRRPNERDKWSRQEAILRHLTGALHTPLDPVRVAEVWAEALEGEPVLDEEIAAMRYMLRKALNSARQAQDLREYTHLTEIYGMGSVRLMRLLQRQTGHNDLLVRYFHKAIFQALAEVVEEMGLK